MRKSLLTKPENPHFSSGPTKKPKEWDLKKINKQFLGRYHRSSQVIDFMKNLLLEIKKTLSIPQNFEVILVPGSCTGAMESIIWSLLGENKITSIIYDFWADDWSKTINRLNYRQEIRKSLDGNMPSLENIDISNDLLFVFTGTSTGMSLTNLDWIPSNHKGLTICDATSAVFIYDLEWEKLDATAFSLQKALGSEAQHGIIVLSPKAQKALKEKKKINMIPKTLDLRNYKFPINTPSILCLQDFSFCLNWLQNKGGQEWSRLRTLENKGIIDKWIENSEKFEYFVKESFFRSLTPCYLVLRDRKSEHKLLKMIKYLENKGIAFDIKSYRKANLGIRIWTGPTIIKKDLISLINWLDWSFDNIN